MNICDTYILNGRCGDTEPLFYAFEDENDMNDYYKEEIQIEEN